jgi:hypothetical protein
MEKYLLVQLDPRAQMLTLCGVEVRHCTHRTKVPVLVPYKIHCIFFLFPFLVYFCEILVCCESVSMSALSAMYPAHHKLHNLTTLTVLEGRQ